MKRILISAVVVVAAVAFVIVAGGASSGSSSSSDPTYHVELDNAFGLVSGEEFKVAGVPAGTISNVGLDQKTLHAIVSVKVTQSGLGDFHSDTECESRPQSLIGEYFLNCDPGTSGALLKSGATIPVTQTQSTIPADLLTDIMRLPYSQRLTLIINELGAGVAGNSDNLQAALERAVPALTETDSLLNLLANDSHTLQNLTASADSLVTALANNTGSVDRFIDQSNTLATDTETQDTNLKATFQNLPPFLEQLRPALAHLGDAVTANEPALQNLNSSAGQIDRLLTNLPPFGHAALPALRSLGQASVVGKTAVIAAKPTVKSLNAFSTHLPELSQNLAIVLQSLDSQSRAVEKDPRSPGGVGFSGLEALLQYVFNQTLDLDYLGPWGHVQAIDAFLSPTCSAYATPATIATNASLMGTAQTRKCYSFLGPNQIGVNEPDPTDPGACPPDPGGEPPTAPAGAHPSVSSTCKLSALTKTAAAKHTTKSKDKETATSAAASRSSSSGPPIDLKQTIGQLVGSSATGAKPAQTTNKGQSSSSSSSSNSSGSSSSPSSSAPLGQTQQLLNYLMSP